MAILYRIAIICFVLLMVSPIQGLAAAPGDVQAAAEQGLAQFLSTIPPAELANMGLTTGEDIKAATLGEPYEQFTIYPEALENYTPDQSLSSMLTTTDNWVYPVMVNGKAKTQLNVVKTDGKWVAGYFGGTLPTRIQDGVSLMSTTFGSGNDKGITRTSIAGVKLVRIPQVNADFLFVGTQADEYLFPIDGGRAMVQTMSGKVYNALEIIPTLNIEVSNAIKAWNQSEKE